MLKRYALSVLYVAQITANAQMVLRAPTTHMNIEKAVAPLVLPRHLLHSAAGSAKAASVIQLGGAANFYSILLTSQDQVAYNPDINTVIFEHRQDPADHGGLGTNNSLRVDHSTDGGATWTVDQTLITPNMFAGTAAAVGIRYPNCALYNPSGNTDPANAYVVSHTNALQALTGARFWGWVAEASTKLDGTFATDAYVDHFGDTSTYQPSGLVANPNGDVWSASTRYRAVDDPLNFSVLNLNKGVFNNGTSAFDWTIQNVIDPDLFIAVDGNPIYINHTMAFSPDGQVGYLVLNAKANDGLAQGPVPMLWKTTDGGSSWNPLPGHDFSNDAAYTNVLEPATDTGLPRPWFSDMDCVVDHNGTLHVFSEVFSGYHSSPDSQNYVFSDIQTQYLFHATTSDGTDWNSRLVTNVPGTDYGLPSSDPAFVPLQSNRPQASRTADGTRVFFSWNSSGPNESENYIPDVWAFGHDVDGAMSTQPKNLTIGTDAEGNAWFHTVSPVCISNGSEHQYELPIVFGEHNGDVLGHADFYYVRGVGFDDAEFVVGVEEQLAPLRADVYPNPSTGRFMVSGHDLVGAQLLITDAVGRPVLSTTVTDPTMEVELPEAAAGTYFLLLRSDMGQATRKVVVY